MALTIRTLSPEAERTLERVQEDYEHINTNSKAIEFVLEQFPILTDELESEKIHNAGLRKELSNAKYKLEGIANGFTLINTLIAKNG